MRCWSGLTGMLALSLAVAGCAGRSSSGQGHFRGPVDLEVVKRGTLTPDLSALPSLHQVDQILGHPRPVGNYHSLGPDECQCLAVGAAHRANLLDAERRALAAAETKGLCKSQDNSLVYDVLRTAAIEDRNKAAGDALNNYYLLARSEAQLDMVAHGLVDARQAISGFERAHDKGLMVRADKSDFPRREIELRGQQAQLQDSIVQLNAQLWQRIGIAPASPDERIWPATDLTVVVEPLDVEAAVQLGLATRAELGALRRVCYCLDKDSLAAARAAMSQVNPLLGMAPAPTECHGIGGLWEKLKGCLATDRELDQRRNQVCQYARVRESEVAVEIRQAAATVELRLREVALAKETLGQWTGRLDEVQTRTGTGGATFADVAATRLALSKAQADVVAQIVDWKIAQARLKQAQGLLVSECCP